MPGTKSIFHVLILASSKVRRALQSIQYNHEDLCKRLELDFVQEKTHQDANNDHTDDDEGEQSDAELGDVVQLLMQEGGFESLMDAAKEQKEQNVPMGDVTELLKASRQTIAV